MAGYVTKYKVVNDCVARKRGLPSLSWYFPGVKLVYLAILLSVNLIATGSQFVQSFEAKGKGNY